MSETLKGSPDVKPSVFEKTPESWEKFGAQLGGLATEAFEEFGFTVEDPLLGETDDDVAYKNLKDAFLDPTTTIITLAGENDPSKIIAFALAMPINKMDHKREGERTDTAYLYMTAVKSEERGKGIAGVITTALIRELVKNEVQYLERDAVKRDGYDEKVKKHFAKFPGTVLKQYEHERFPDAGVETFFRIDMAKYLSQLEAATAK